MGTTIIGLAALSLSWLFFGRHMCRLLDRFILGKRNALEFSPITINRDRFSLGSRSWPFPRAGPFDPQVADDAAGRLILSFDGASFACGPITTKWAGDPLPEYAFHPDANDEVSFVLRASRWFWPTPFNFSLMGITTSKWRRYAYRQLSWKKASGQRLEIIWRDEQWYYKSTSWADQYNDRIVSIWIDDG